MTVFDYDQTPHDRQGRADWTGAIVAALMAPVFLYFFHLGKKDFGFAVALVLGLVIIAIRLRWKLRKHAWFWATIALVLVLHIPFLFIIRLPQTNIPTLAFALPLAVADFLLISGALSVAEKVFSKGHPSDEENG